MQITLVINGIGQRRSSTARRPLLFGAVLTAAALLAAEAKAQVTVQAPTINRTGSDASLRQGNQTTLYSISHDDCNSNLQFNFAVSVSGATDGFVVYATAAGDCSTAAGRTGTGQVSCWPIASSYPPSGVVTFGAQDFVRYVLQEDCDGNPAPSGSTTSTSGAGGSAVVTPGTEGAVATTLYFMVNPTQGDVACAASSGVCETWTQTEIELTAPPPPTGLSLGSGDGELVVDLTPESNLGANEGYYVFCAPFASAANDPDAGAPDAGVVGAGGAGGAGGSSANSNPCPPGAAFPADFTPDVHSPYACASQIPATSSQIGIQALGDGGALLDNQQYMVAVATYDEVFNVGALSPLMCNSPQATTTFLEEYCADGGPGCFGCGNCNVGAGIHADSLWSLFGIAALAGLAVAMRRNRPCKRQRIGVSGDDKAPGTAYPASRMGR